MKGRRSCPVHGSGWVAASLLTLLVAGPALAGGERRPQGESSGSRGQARTVESGSTPGNRPAPRAVPRNPDQARQPQRQPQRRPQSDGADRRGGTFHGFHEPPFFYPSYRWYPWGWWGGWYYPWGYPWGYGGMGTYWYPEQVRPDMGALDLDVRPEKARVYLDGQAIGVADNFDGWPRELWLEEGTYDLVFYHEGFETISRQYSVYPGVVIAVDDRMVPGVAALPEDLVTRSAANREERLRRRLERGEVPEQSAYGREAPDWRDRVRAAREAAAGEDRTVDARSEPARLMLEIRPADAAIYLDGRFLGTGDELLGTAAGLMVDAGEHELEVVRPGYESKTTTFTAEAGEEVELTVELEPSA